MTTEDIKVKARRKHQCRICGHKIEIDEVHISRAGFDSDGPWRIHMHPECEAQTKEFDDGDWESCGIGEIKPPLRVSSKTLFHKD